MVTWRVRSRLMLVAALPMLGGCGSGATPADPKEVALIESRLLGPFETRGMVVADNAAFEMTANFFTAQFGMPAVTPGRQEMERADLPDGGASYVFRNKDATNLMPFLLGATQFQVRREAKIVVHGGRHPFTLTVDSIGRVSVIDAKGDRRLGSRYQVREGSSILTP